MDGSETGYQGDPSKTIRIGKGRDVCLLDSNEPWTSHILTSKRRLDSGRHYRMSPKTTEHTILPIIRQMLTDFHIRLPSHPALIAEQSHQILYHT